MIEDFSRRKLLKVLGGATAAAAAVGVGKYIEKSSEAPPLTSKGSDEHSFHRTTQREYASDTERVAGEVEYARELLHSSDPLAPLKSPYLTSALYYSDAFLSKVSHDTETTDVPQHILERLIPLITPEVRRRYVHGLNEESKKLFHSADSHRHKPLPTLNWGHGINHPDALDLFSAEGTRVSAMRRGIPVLVEDTWSENAPFETSSPHGGNIIIVYNFDAQEFYRYCHLQETSAEIEKAVQGGQVIVLWGIQVSMLLNPATERIFTWK